MKLIIGLDATLRDQGVIINDHIIYRNDPNPNWGGEVAIYVKNGLPEPVIKIKSNESELLALEFSPDHGKPLSLYAGTQVAPHVVVIVKVKLQTNRCLLSLALFCLL